jgi:poly [ADP-ribose] polymerase
MVPVEKKDAQYQLVESMDKNTHAPTHTEYTLEMLDLLSISRKDEDFVAVEGQPNLLLWHGSRQGNFAGILSEGLRIAPKEAPSTGFIFGKGIHFADLVTVRSNLMLAIRYSNILTLFRFLAEIIEVLLPEPRPRDDG